jgi:hypothetical protein
LFVLGACSSDKQSNTRKLKKLFPTINLLFPDLKEYSIPDSLFRPKTQIELIEEQNNIPTIPKGAKITTPEKAKNPKLEAVQKEAVAEVENKNQKRTKGIKTLKKLSSKRRYYKKKGLKNSISHLKMFKRSPKGRKASGGKGGGY